jgi:hypothetical protein
MGSRPLGNCVFRCLQSELLDAEGGSCQMGTRPQLSSETTLQSCGRLGRLDEHPGNGDYVALQLALGTSKMEKGSLSTEISGNYGLANSGDRFMARKAGFSTVLVRETRHVPGA